ncbi:MAG: hypothetical protein IT380_06320 [Myxococcales bacterium]|nr:hypothetical protein [Myxococcales bacterium]
MQLPLAPLRRVLPRAAPPPPYPAFLVSGLLATLTVGALSGALNLWSLHAQAAPVPVDHHRSHAFAQLFGFMLLVMVGVSFHLVPRFFAAPLPGSSTVRLVKWTAISGLWLLIAGRLGALVPGSVWLGLAGAALLLVGVTAWALFLARLRLASKFSPDWLQPFLLAGAGWWWLAALLVLGWQVGQAFLGPLVGLPLEAVYAAALYGGTASWLWGIFFRAGPCTLRIARSTPEAGRPAFVAWQLAVALQVLAPFQEDARWTGAAALALAAAALVFVAAVRPFRRPAGALPGEPLMRRAVQWGFLFALAFAGLTAWSGLSAWGLVAGAPFLADAARHAFTLGCCTLLVLGFTGRMVPSFEAVALPWPWLYDAGVVAVAVGALARLASVAAPLPWARATSGASGFIAFAGMSAVAGCYFAALWRGRKARRASPGLLAPLSGQPS